MGCGWDVDGMWMRCGCDVDEVRMDMDEMWMDVDEMWMGCG